MRIPPQIRLGFHDRLPVDIGFDAPLLSSNGGAVLLRQMDDALGLSHGLAARVPDPRRQEQVVHSRLEQVRQRLYQIVLGYEDCNDANALRRDPALQVACDLKPRGSRALSSQPTLSRLENTVQMGDIRSILDWLEQSFVDGLAEGTETVVLDIDTTSDPTHGSQQLAFFHGFYDTHMYHPMLVFDGESGELITAILKPGNTHASRGALGVLRRLVQRLKARFPDLSIVVRGDSGFCVPRLLHGLEELKAEFGDVDYLLGLARNPVLQRMLEPGMERAAARYATTQLSSRVFAELSYAAATWDRPRRVIGKAEYMSYGPNPRFIITSIDGFGAEALYRAYCGRGQAENFIKDLKNGLKADRLSCHRFAPNFFRLLLHAVAYRLMLGLRQEVAALAPQQGRCLFGTLRLTLLKVAVVVRESCRRILIRLPYSFPLANLFRNLALRLAPS